jgi:hypothetical protein
MAEKQENFLASFRLFVIDFFSYACLDFNNENYSAHSGYRSSIF